MFNTSSRYNLGLFGNSNNVQEIVQPKEEKEKVDKNSIEKPCKKKCVKPTVLFC
jgi:hypothetical protein